MAGVSVRRRGTVAPDPVGRSSRARREGILKWSPWPSGSLRP